MYVQYSTVYALAQRNHYEKKGSGKNNTHARGFCNVRIFGRPFPLRSATGTSVRETEEADVLCCSMGGKSRESALCL
jgi:hypothetical protein